MLYPDTIDIDSSETDIETKCEPAYRFFQNEILNGNLSFNGKNISFRRFAEIHNMHRSFWHAVSDSVGNRIHRDEDRIFSEERACKIGWIVSTINSTDSLYYKEGNRWALMLDQNYVVILEERQNYMLFITGYPVRYPNATRTFMIKYNAYKT